MRTPSGCWRAGEIFGMPVETLNSTTSCFLISRGTRGGKNFPEVFQVTGIISVTYHHLPPIWPTVEHCPLWQVALHETLRKNGEPGIRRAHLSSCAKGWGRHTLCRKNPQIAGIFALYAHMHRCTHTNVYLLTCLPINLLLMDLCLFLFSLLSQIYANI